jgi:hypothetical protein
MTSCPETHTPEMVNTILLDCALLRGDSNFGLRMIELAHTLDLGIYGYVLMNAPTVGKALEANRRYRRPLLDSRATANRENNGSFPGLPALLKPLA